MNISDIFQHDENYKTIMKRLFEASLEQSFNAIMITEAGLGYPIIYVNPAFSLLTGYAPTEVIGKTPAILQGPETDPDVLNRLEQDLAEGNLFHGRALNYRKDGSTFMMEWKIAPIRNDEGRVSHFLAVQRDVSGK